MPHVKRTDLKKRLGSGIVDNSVAVLADLLVESYGLKCLSRGVVCFDFVHPAAVIRYEMVLVNTSQDAGTCTSLTPRYL